MLTVADLEKMEPGTIFAEGIVENSPEGIYMTDDDLGRKLYWLAKRGNIPDWCIYIHWADYGRAFVEQEGDKVSSKDNIQKLVPCDDAAYKAYRK